MKQTVWIVKQPELGWDDIVGVYVTKEAILEEGFYREDDPDLVIQEHEIHD